MEKQNDFIEVYYHMLHILSILFAADVPLDGREELCQNRAKRRGQPWKKNG